METQGKIADVQSSRLQAWQPELVLSAPDSNLVRFSRGFLRARPQEWFDALTAHWVPLFHSLGATVSVEDIGTSLDFPEQVDRVTPVEIDGETAIIALDNDSMEALVDAVCGTGSEVTRDAGALIIIDYLERRFLSTLMMSWTGAQPLTCFSIPPERTEAVEVVGLITIELSVNGKRCVVRCGIGPRLLERLDLLWRERVQQENESGATEAQEQDETLGASIELVELAVPPAMLIDYVRSGTVINLGIPVSSKATLRIDGEAVAHGELVQCNGRFAFQISNVDLAPTRPSNTTTRVQVEIAHTEIERRTLAELLQPGAVLLTRTALSPSAAMVISGENVASAIIGQIDGQFALNILPK